MSSPRRRIETDVMKSVTLVRLGGIRILMQTGCTACTRQGAAFADHGRLMSDYEVTLVNDNSECACFQLQTRTNRAVVYDVPHPVIQFRSDVRSGPNFTSAFPAQPTVSLVLSLSDSTCSRPQRPLKEDSGKSTWNYLKTIHTSHRALAL
jgi:hypothetical protein